MVEEKLEQRVRCLKVVEKLEDNFYDRLVQILDTGMFLLDFSGKTLKVRSDKVSKTWKDTMVFLIEMFGYFIYEAVHFIG